MAKVHDFLRDAKSTWPNGSWQKEADEYNWVDPDTGLPCRIRRGVLGSLCGYVGVSVKHPAFGMHYYPINQTYRTNPVECSVAENIQWWRRHVTQRVEYQISDIQIHGGLTFGGKFIDSEQWWFGFDCGHHFDLSPGLVKVELSMHDAEYRDVFYVTNQCTFLAEQLAVIYEKERAHREVGTGKSRSR